MVVYIGVVYITKDMYIKFGYVYRPKYEQLTIEKSSMLYILTICIRFKLTINASI